jgi:hypothetical protein
MVSSCIPWLVGECWLVCEVWKLTGTLPQSEAQSPSTVMADRNTKLRARLWVSGTASFSDNRDAAKQKPRAPRAVLVTTGAEGECHPPFPDRHQHERI